MQNSCTALLPQSTKFLPVSVACTRVNFQGGDSVRLLANSGQLVTIDKLMGMSNPPMWGTDFLKNPLYDLYAARKEGSGALHW